MTNKIPAIDDAGSKPGNNPDKPLKNGEAEGSVEKIVRDAEKTVHDMTESFSTQFYVVIGKIVQIQKIEEKTVEAVTEGEAELAILWDLALRLGMPEAEAEAHRHNIRLRSYFNLMKEEFGAIRHFYRNIPADLQKTAASHPEERSDSKTVSIVLETLGRIQGGQYLLKEFSPELRELLAKPFDPLTLEAFRGLVMQKVYADPDMAKKDVFMKLLIEQLEFFMNVKGNSQLSVEAIQGMVGQVPSEPEMQEIFKANLDFLKNLPAGSIRVTFPNQDIRTFYHVTGAEVPADIAAFIKDPKNVTPILNVHYRTNESVQKLLAAMSAGEFLECSMADGTPVKIEGVNGSDKDVVIIHPASLDEAELFNEPMKFLSHDFTFSKKK